MQDYLSENKDISKKVKYSIKERGQDDRARLAKIFLFKGPDHDTQVVLHSNVARWKMFPDDIWIRPLPAALGSINAEAQIVGCYIMAIRDDA